MPKVKKLSRNPESNFGETFCWAIMGSINEAKTIVPRYPF